MPDASTPPITPAAIRASCAPKRSSVSDATAIRRSTTERELRVTHVVFDLNGGGLETLVATLTRAFATQGVRSSVVTLGGRAGRVGESLRGDLETFHVSRGAGTAGMLLPRTLAVEIARTRADVVHLHSGAWYKPALAARMAGVPRIVYTEHGREHYDPLLMRVLDRQAARWTSAVVAVSDRLRDYLHVRLGIPRARLHTIANAVDTSEFCPDPDGGVTLRSRLGIPADALVIGSVGRLEHVKGYDRLLEVFARLRRADGLGGRLRLVLCGDGGERAALARQAEALGIADAVHFTGWMDRPVALYRALDVFAVTSRSEGLSISLLEAMASGAAPVVNDVGANREALGPELAAQVTGSDDWDDFVRVVARTVNTRDALARVRDAAVRRVRSRFGLEGTLRRYRAVYEGTPGA